TRWPRDWSSDVCSSDLSVACGPARELEEFFVTDDDYDRLEVTLLDQDDEALAAARMMVDVLGQRKQRPLSVKWVNDSVRTLLREIGRASCRERGEKQGG